MFRVILKTENKETFIRTNVISYEVQANVLHSYVTSSINSASSPNPIVNYQAVIYTDKTQCFNFILDNANDVNDFIEKMAMAEEEQLTSEQISMDDLYQYAAEKLLGGKHEAIPGFKIPVVEFKGRLIVEQPDNVRMRDFRGPDVYYTTGTSVKGGGKNGFGL